MMQFQTSLKGYFTVNLGLIMIWHGFIAATGATLWFFLDGRKEQRKQLVTARLSSKLFFMTAAAAITASVVLLYQLLSHQFQYAYVAKYSSSAQPLLYLISAFWAGQEGTFLLWALLTTVMGLVLLKKTTDYYAMSVVSGYGAFLFLLMIVKSPFEVTVSVPHDGAGMNPLLQDPWMAIHPPILFLGYAATIFPFALVISGLIRRNYTRWFDLGFSWTLFASCALGAGIIIGGFWAYEVLGWGGYWGWDPVENSSLVPWLTLLALIHGLLVQKHKGSLVRTNLFLAIMSFLFVAYATFLTRSGVLADFSVHSFVDLGINNYLIGVMVASSAIGFGLFATRFSQIKSPKLDMSSLNRELTLLLGLFALCVGALFTFVGMSSPIFTGLVGKASQVDTSFYNKVNMPVAIGIALLLGVTPFLGWTVDDSTRREERKIGILKRFSMSVALTVLSCIIAYVAGVRTVMQMVFVGTAAFALISNVIIAFRQYRSGWMSLGGPVAHIGVGLLLIGIIGSGAFDVTKHIVLKQGEPQSVQGYQLTFKGIDENNATKPSVLIEVSDGAQTYVATPKLYYSEYNQALMREPDIKIYPLTDLYISPVEIKADEHMHGQEGIYELTKGETKEINGYQITFARFEMGSHSDPGAMAVGAVLNVSAEGKNHEAVPQLVFNQRGERQMMPAELPILSNGTNGKEPPHVSLNAISVEQKKVFLELHGVGNESHVPVPLQLILEVSTKPLMMVVWTGVVLIIAGTALSFKRRISVA
jgi:cytochrome c-type biogenesis protein CcmF